MRAAPWLVAALVTLGGALYAGRTIDHQWVPHDEGALAQSAERTAHGQLPHRDFEELYTGGLTQVNALAFRVLGVRLRNRDKCLADVQPHHPKAALLRELDRQVTWSGSNLEHARPFF